MDNYADWFDKLDRLLELEKNAESRNRLRRGLEGWDIFIIDVDVYCKSSYKLTKCCGVNLSRPMLRMPTKVARRKKCPFCRIVEYSEMVEYSDRKGLNRKMGIGLSNQDEFWENQQEDDHCKSCSNPEIEDGYALLLCKECRNQLVARSVPLWIKGTTFVIAILLVYALIRFPATLQAGVHYEKGLRAEQETLFKTAAEHYEQAVDRFPDSTLILSKLFLAYFANGQVNEAYQTFDLIAGREASSNDMANIINEDIELMESWYYQDEELVGILNVEGSTESLIEQLRGYVEKNPASVAGQYLLADILFDAKQYDDVERIMLQVLESTTRFNEGSLLLAAAYREQGEYEKARDATVTVLSQNRESADAYFALSRIDMKQQLNEEGLSHAQIAYDLNADNSSMIANLALANHYNKNNQERDHLLSLLKERGDYGADNLNRLESVFKGETNWLY